MIARFAGSLELAQRRRRRLAQEADRSPVASGTPRTSRISETVAVLPQISAGQTYSGPRLPRDTMIPGSWKIITLLGGLGFACWCGVIWLSHSLIAEQMGLSQLVSLSSGSIPRYFSTVALLLTAQLSLLIYWHRSRSRKDFLGRYRVWGWAGLFWCLLCLANATQVHIPLLNYLNSQYTVNCWRGPELFWFVPLAVCMLALYRLIGRDVNPSRASAVAWNIAFCIGLVVAGFSLGLDLLLPRAWRSEITAGTAMLWQYSLALFCLIHARYVTHVTNEAGGKRLSLRSRLSRRLTSQLTCVGERVLSVRCLRPRRQSAKQKLMDQPDTKKTRIKSKSKLVSQTKSETDAVSTIGKELMTAEDHTQKQNERSHAGIVRATDPASKISTSKTSAGTPNPDTETATSPSWRQRLKFSLKSRWKKSPEKTESSSKASAEKKMERPAPVPVNVKKQAEGKQAVGKQVGKKRDEKQELPSDSVSSPTWGSRLKNSLTSRWTRREDAAVPAGTPVAAPHLSTMKPHDERSKPAPVTTPAANVVPTANAPAKPTTSPAVSRPAPQSAAASRPHPQRHPNHVDIDDDDADDDYGSRGGKDRKRQKNRRRDRG